VKLCALMAAINDTTEYLINKEQCGWLDGGCMTLASAIIGLFPTASLYHISRNKERVDHVVTYFPKLDCYFDADGLQFKNELFRKMQIDELVNVTILEKMNTLHFDQIEIFPEIKEILINHYQTSQAKILLSEKENHLSGCLT